MIAVEAEIFNPLHSAYLFFYEIFNNTFTTFNVQIELKLFFVN